jgi:hypothetical protein
MSTLGAVASAVPVPFTSREIVSPFAVKLTFALAVTEAVGVKRTTTA